MVNSRGLRAPATTITERRSASASVVFLFLGPLTVSIFRAIQKPAIGCPGSIRDQQRRTSAAIDEPKLLAGWQLPPFRFDLCARANGNSSALAGGGGRDREEQAACRPDYHVIDPD